MSDTKNGVEWDLTSFFTEFNNQQMQAMKQKLSEDIAELQKKASAAAPLSAETAPIWEEIILKSEDIDTRFGHIYSYITCLTAADAKNEEYAQEEGSLTRLIAEYEKFVVDILRAFKDAPDDVFDAFISRESLKGAEHPLRKIREKAKHTMTPDMEKLTAELNVDGLHSWGRLYDKLTGKLEFEMVYPDGRVERKPISQWRALMSDADRAIGKAAFDCGNKAWAGIEDTCAAALNAISGVRLTLNKYRGIDDFLYWALYQSSIKRESLEAMYKAIHDNLDIAREIFRVKARFMGRDGIWWFEREAPLPLKDAALYNWNEGAAMVGKAYATAYPKLAEYYRSFIKKRWVESERRPGKRPGAFCTGSPLTKEQRVYMTYNGTIGDTSTLAHEVGHAFHGHVMRDLRTMAKEYPMTLAETASIFSELIFAEGVYGDNQVSDTQKLLILDGDLSSAAVMLLDITIRFEFEKAFHEERQKGELTVSRFKELMVETQRRVFGDALLDGGEDSLFWASKLHFYITQVTFYNFPYTFGFLLARALFKLFKDEGPSFLPRYEEFLKLTGSDTAENVAKRSIGADITDPTFWAASIHGLEEPLKLYKELLEKNK
jgi:oligoendopeptidase F